MGRPKKQIIIYKSWDDLPLILSLAQVSILTDMGPERIRQLCAAGELPGFKVGSKWRIDKNDLQEFWNSRKTVKMGD